MASAVELVLAAMQSLESRKELSVSSTRAATTKDHGKKVFAACAEELDKLQSFSEELVLIIKSACKNIAPGKVSARQRKAIWVSISIARSEKLPQLWRSFLTGINCPTSDPLFMEMVNDSLIEKIIANAQPDPPSSREGSNFRQHLELSRDEENIIRYACGYVGMKLNNRYYL